MKKKKVAVIFGGTNTEHEVSIVSAKGVLKNLNKDKYEVLPILITKANKWIANPKVNFSYDKIENVPLEGASSTISSISKVFQDYQIDIVFPLLHGPYGEDGTIQGLFETLRVPYVGSGVTSSAVCMDKVIQKGISHAYNIKTPRYIWFSQDEWQTQKKDIFDRLEKKFPGGYPLFVKPANQGSSIGITKVHNEDELRDAIQLALSRDLKVIVEEAIPNAKEIECSIIGTNFTPKASVLGEIVPGNEFYDYNAKYLDDNSVAHIPADLPGTLAKNIQQVAIKSFQVMDCDGLARVDFLLNAETQEFYLSELNTMPGFTPISMYPKLWEASGLSYPDQIDLLLDLALKRRHQKAKLNFSR